MSSSEKFIFGSLLKNDFVATKNLFVCGSRPKTMLGLPSYFSVIAIFAFRSTRRLCSSFNNAMLYRSPSRPLLMMLSSTCSRCTSLSRFSTEATSSLAEGNAFTTAAFLRGAALSTGLPGFNEDNVGTFGTFGIFRIRTDSPAAAQSLS